MAKKTINFTITKDASVTAFDIEVDDDEVTIVNGKGSKDVETGAEHELDWRFSGGSGATLSITGKVGEKKVVDVSDNIPDGHDHGEGFQNFTVD
jgi:hypothetical protein